MRHMISLKEQSREDILKILDMAIKLKDMRNKGIVIEPLKQKTMVMFFQKTSTRTRLSFEQAMTELGGHAIFLDAKNTQFSLTDFEDEIQAVMRFSHILMFRATKVKDVETAAKFNRVPVIDACSEKYHPCQALSDILTMAEKSNGIQNVKKIVYLGIENNVSNTLMLACAKIGIKVVLCCPEIDQDCVDDELFQQGFATGNFSRTTDIAEALKDADYVHTDTWMNMEFFENGKVKDSKKEEYESRKKKFAPFQLNAEKINKYCPNAHIMHCMPCHVGYEISHDAIHHPHSVIYDQAENRMHMQKVYAMQPLLSYPEVPHLTNGPAYNSVAWRLDTTVADSKHSHMAAPNLVVNIKVNDRNVTPGQEVADSNIMFTMDEDVLKASLKQLGKIRSQLNKVLAASAEE